MDSRFTSPRTRANSIEEQLCSVCRGISESNTGFDFQNESEMRVYAHQPHLSALSNSASNGCILCKYVLEGFQAVPGVDDSDIRLSIDLSASPQAHPSCDETFVSETAQDEAVTHVRVETRETVDGVERFESCAPVRFEVKGTLAEGTARIHTLYYPASNRKFRGRIFVSRSLRLPEDFRYLDFVMSGRCSQTLLQCDMQTSVEVFSLRGSPIASSVPNRPVSCNRLSEAALDVLRKWTQSCSNQHNECGSFFDKQTLPTRVIKVNPEGSDDTVRLQLSNGGCGRFMALSYCWGNPKQLLTTTRASVTERLLGIHLDLLPATFRDAVLLCRALNIEYLWIDALCIVQDDEDDWAIESSEMAGIYGRSALTLSATMGSSVSSGFLQKPEMGHYPSILWKDSMSKQAGDLYLRPKTEGWRHVLSENAPLMKRGWALQERLLAPRVVHYGQQMFWECRQCMWSEDEQFNQDLNQPEHSDKYANKLLNRRLSLRQAEGKWPLSKYWFKILEDYTSRCLTNEMDKLSALAGLAQDAQRRSGDAYCAGLWRSSLPYDLLWRRKRAKFMETPSKFRAPTWSWAALDGQIDKWRKGGHLADNQDSLAYDHYVEIGVSHVNVKHYPNNPFGRVESGYIDLQGPISVLTPMVAESYDVPEGLESEAREAMDNDYPGQFLLTPDFPTENLWTCVFDREVDIYATRLWVLRIMITTLYTRMNGGRRYVHAFKYGGLIVERVEDAESVEGIEDTMRPRPYPYYRRLGLAWLTVKGNSIRSRSEWPSWSGLDSSWGRHNENVWHSATLRLI